MGPITRFLVRRFVRPEEEYDTRAESKAAYGLLEGYLSTLVNTLLFGVKLAFGLLTGSLALVADAVHTLADSVTSIIVIVMSYLSRRPADPEHPFGHGRAEAIATMAISLLLAVAGFEFARTSVERIVKPEPVDATWLAIGVVLATAGIKEWLSRFARDLAVVSANKALEADFWHHRSDVMATCIVAVGMIATRYGYLAVDGVAGIGVSLVMLWAAWSTGRQAIDSILGAAPSRQEVEEISRKAMEVEGVDGVHDIVIHSYGDTRFISLHIETSADASPQALHSIAEKTQKHIATGDHGSVVVHVDPIDRSHPLYDRICDFIEGFVSADPDLQSFHDLRLVKEKQTLKVLLDIGVGPGCTHTDEVRDRLAASIQAAFPQTRAEIEIEPQYAYRAPER